jgi:succinoglycan biosynthesis protein ExoA
MTWTCVRPEQTDKTTLPPTSAMPFVSIIVPVRNEARFIRATVTQLLEQDYDPERFEVLVADGQSTDETAEIVRDLAALYENLRLLDNPGRWSSAGRNRAIRAARGDILVVIDGHCDLHNTRYLRELVAAFERSGADCIGRPQPLEVRSATLLQRAIAAARSSWLGHQPTSHIYANAEGFVAPQSVAVAYRRRVFEIVGLFDEDFDACEDVELNDRVARAGLRCFFTPAVSVTYYPRTRLSGLFRQLARYGRGRVRLMRKRPETFTPACLVPAVFVLGLLLGPVLAWLSSALGAAYAGTVCLYAALVALASAMSSLRARDVRLLLWLPLVFVTIHLGAGCGSLLELFVPGRAAATRQPTIVPLPATPSRRRTAA